MKLLRVTLLVIGRAVGAMAQSYVGAALANDDLEELILVAHIAKMRLKTS